MTLIHPMSYKPQFFIDEVLQCLVDKYQITYQNIWGERMIRPHLVELDHYKVLEPLKGAPDFNHFLRKKVFLEIAVTKKENFKNKKTYQKFFGERAVRPPGKRGHVPLIHSMSYKPQIFTNVVLQCLVDRDVITYQNIWSEGKVRPHRAIATLGDY